MRDNTHLWQLGNAFQSICSRQGSLRGYLDPLEFFRSWACHVDPKLSRHQEEQEGNGGPEEEVFIKLLWEVRVDQEMLVPKAALAFGKIALKQEWGEGIFLCFSPLHFLQIPSSQPLFVSHPFIQQMCMEITVYGHKLHPQFYWHIVRDCPLWHTYNNSACLACGKLPINKDLLVWLLKKPMNLWMNGRMDQWMNESMNEWEGKEGCSAQPMRLC